MAEPFSHSDREESTISVETPSRSRRSLREVDLEARAKKRATLKFLLLREERNELFTTDGWATKYWGKSGFKLEEISFISVIMIGRSLNTCQG